MGLFDNFPYTNFHELNLDWILRALREIEATIDQFVAINALKYANPIQWDITRQYENNTIVIDPQTGTAYISTAPVPVGVALSNTDYWRVVFDLQQFVTRANNNFTLRVEEATTLTATFATNAGQWLVWGGHLYEALVNIIAGDQYVIDSNIKRITVEDVTGDLVDLNTAIKSNLVAAINSEIAARTAADQVLDNSIVIERDARIAADQALDNSIVIERDARIAADDTKEINQSSRNYILIFDSYGALGVSTIAAQACTGGVHVLNVGGAGFVAAGGGSTWGDALTAYVATLTDDEKAAVTDVMIFGGVNDFNELTTAIINAMSTMDSYIRSNLPNAKVTVAPVSFPIRQDSTPTKYTTQVLAGYSRGATYLGWKYVEGLNVAIHNDNLMESDGIHPNSTGVDQLGHIIKNYILTGEIPKITTEAAIMSLAGGTGITLSGSTIYSQIVDNEVYCAGDLVVNASGFVTVPSGASGSLLIGNYTNSYLFGNIMGGRAANVVTVPAYIHDNGGNWTLKPVILQFYYGRIYLSVEGGAITFDALQTTQFTFNCGLAQG